MSEARMVTCATGYIGGDATRKPGARYLTDDERRALLAMFSSKAPEPTPEPAPTALAAEHLEVLMNPPDPYAAALAAGRKAGEMPMRDGVPDPYNLAAMEGARGHQEEPAADTEEARMKALLEPPDPYAAALAEGRRRRAGGAR